MNDAAISILTTERQRYLDFFTQAISDLKKHRTTCASELLIQTDNPAIPEVFNLIRVDFIFKNTDNQDSISELRLDKNLSYQPSQLTINNSAVTIRPFCWNSAEITAANLAINELETWIIKWIKADDESEEEFSEAIHSCTFPESTDGITRFVVDFGTSPVESFISLADCLTNAGASELTIETTVV